MSRLFLSDLDGTLIQKKPCIASSDVKAIKKWKAKGNLFGLVTGRDYVYCISLLSKYDIEPDCLITCNGAMVHVGDKRIYSSLIDLDVATKIYKDLVCYVDDMDCFYTSDDGSNCFCVDTLKDRFEKIKKDYAYLGVINDEDLFLHLSKRSEGLTKITVSMRTEENCTKYLPILQKQFLDVEVIPTSPDYIEMTRKNTNKSNAIKALIEHENLNVEDIAFIGDGLNDVGLFDYLDYTYVMDKASNQVKSHAKITVSSVSEAIEIESERK